MASKKAQTNIANGNGQKNVKLKTSEGKVLFQKVEYTLGSWVENETDYLRSAMSYTNFIIFVTKEKVENKSAQHIRHNSTK